MKRITEEGEEEEELEEEYEEEFEDEELDDEMMMGEVNGAGVRELESPEEEEDVVEDLGKREQVANPNGNAGQSSGLSLSPKAEDLW